MSGSAPMGLGGGLMAVSLVLGLGVLNLQHCGASLLGKGPMWADLGLGLAPGCQQALGDSCADCGGAG